MREGGRKNSVLIDFYDTYRVKRMGEWRGLGGRRREGGAGGREQERQGKNILRCPDGSRLYDRFVHLPFSLNMLALN